MPNNVELFVEPEREVQLDGDPVMKGDKGDPGYSPTVAVEDITGGHRVTITDEDGAHVFDVMDGQGGGDPTSIIDDTAGEGDTTKVWSANKSAGEIAGLNNEITQLDRDKLDAPSTAGTSDQVLTSDGQGGQSWKTPNPVINVSGSTPSITGIAGTRYICGEVSTLDITVPETGIIDVTFDSSSTATVLTITPPTGQTVRWANGFDPTVLEADTTYEINICDCLGVAGAWS